MLDGFELGPAIRGVQSEGIAYIVTTLALALTLTRAHPPLGVGCAGALIVTFI